MQDKPSRPQPHYADPTRTERRCARCGLSKPLGAFRTQRNGTTPAGYCLPCENDYAREWHRKNPERSARNKHAWFVKSSKRFSVWKLDGSLGGLYFPYGRILQGDPCSYCGGPAGHLDHIVPVEEIKKSRATKRGEWANLTATCQRCNILKERASLLEFLGWPRGWLRRT